MSKRTMLYKMMYTIMPLLALILLFSPCASAQAESHVAATGYVAVDANTRLYYQRSGAGTPMLLVPGWSFNGDIFTSQITHFSGNHDVIAIDPRGQGRSTKGAEGNSYRQHGADLAAVLRELHLGRVIFVGWSWGCYDVLSYVRQSGAAQVARFVCLDEPPRGWSTRPDEWAGLHSLETFAELYRAVADHRQAFTDDFVTSTVTRPLTTMERETLVSISMQTPDHVALALAADGMMSDYAGEATLLAQKVPTLYILREESRNQAATWMAEHMPETRVVFKGGHLMFWEFPDEIDAVIYEFINWKGQ